MLSKKLSMVIVVGQQKPIGGEHVPGKKKVL
jgi:hypothetical protein